MSDCSKNWKLPKEYRAEVKRIKTKGGIKYGLRVGPRRVLMDEQEASEVLADLMVLLKEVEGHD